jgi:hypothetical protein
MERQMTKMTFVSVALIAATVVATQAMAARNDLAARHATTKDCVRAPNVGAFASDPYTVPPACPTPLPARSNSDEESGWQTSPARLS